jgi:hypothetical protein
MELRVSQAFHVMMHSVLNVKTAKQPGSGIGDQS